MPGSYSEESLDTGIDRQLDAFRDVQQQMANFANDLSRLKASCDALKAQRTKLQNECAALEREQLFLKSSTTRIKAEHDALQTEYAGLVDETTILRSSADHPDASGRMARKLWLQTEKVARLEEQLATAEAEREVCILAEREVAAGLRDRIAQLEREGSASVERENSSIENLRHEMEVLVAANKRLKGDNQDARDATRAEAKRRRSAESQVEKLTEQLQAVREEARLAKDAVAERDQLKEKLDKLMAELEQLKAKGSPRARAPMSPNIATPAPPRTPTKSTIPPPASLDSPTPSNATGTPNGTPKTSLASKYEYLQRKHTELKNRFDQMRAKYAKDIQHWKEYRAIQIARQELRQKRRQDKNATGSVAGDDAPRETNAGESMPASGPSSSVHAPSSEPHPPESAGESVADPPQPNDISSPSTPTSRPRLAATTPLARTTVSAPPPPSQTAKTVNLTSTKAASTPNRVPPAAYETPKASSVSAPNRQLTTPTASELRSSRQPARVTPWLGTSTRKVSDSGPSARPRRTSFSDDDDDSDAIKSGTGIGVRTPLVRDRTGMGESATNLRRAALQRSVTHVNGESAAPVTPDTDERKRKLDLEHLSPAERAAQRKKLSRLSTAERRDLYAPYKGKGRYVAPEDVQRTVADEYEIDPARNDGVAHQFHNVVRNREERRKMHGGDCECCRDYYEAIGPLPRFNQAPAWNDTSEENGDSLGTGMELADHQNRISRHREVWRKPPTPPDYWKIGFPSTQDVARVNEQADEMERRRQAEIRREVAHKNSKWRKKV